MDLLNTLWDAREQLEISANRIDRLALSFEATGNTLVSEKLEQEALMIRKSIESIMDAFRDQQKRDLEESKRGVAEALSAVLGVCPK